MAANSMHVLTDTRMYTARYCGPLQAHWKGSGLRLLAIKYMFITNQLEIIFLLVEIALSVTKPETILYERTN